MLLAGTGAVQRGLPDDLSPVLLVWMCCEPLPCPAWPALHLWGSTPSTESHHSHMENLPSELWNGTTEKSVLAIRMEHADLSPGDVGLQEQMRRGVQTVCASALKICKV